MKSLYTITFDEFLDYLDTDSNAKNEWNNSILPLFNNFPNFYVQGVRDSSGTYSNIVVDSLYNMFTYRYGICEIGSETIDLFLNACKSKLNEINVKYLPKIALLNQVVYAVDSTTNKNELFTNTFTMETTDDYMDCGYIYPINTTTTKLSGKTTNSGTKTQKIPLNNKSYIELTKEILELPAIYNQILDELSSLFMQIL